MTWRRLTERLAGKTEPEPLAEGVPEYLDIPLRQWVYRTLERYPLTGAIALRLRLPSSIHASHNQTEALVNYHDAKTPLLVMEMADTTLALLAEADYDPTYRGEPDLRIELAYILDTGNSAFEVAPDGSALRRRIDEALQCTLDGAAPVGSSAADLLREAVAALYGLKTDPGLAYSKAVKAVEAVANPRFLPNHREPTLGLVRSHLDQGRHKYQMAIVDRTGAPAGIDAVVEILGLLWHGQRDRHAGGPTSAPITQEAAETAVHTAALLVHWISSGSILKK